MVGSTPTSRTMEIYERAAILQEELNQAQKLVSSQAEELVRLQSELSEAKAVVHLYVTAEGFCRLCGWHHEDRSRKGFRHAPNCRLYAAAYGGQPLPKSPKCQEVECGRCGAVKTFYVDTFKV